MSYETMLKRFVVLDAGGFEYGIFDKLENCWVVRNISSRVVAYGIRHVVIEFRLRNNKK